MTFSQTFLLVFFITVTSHPSFVTSEQTCVTPTIPCDWPNCPQGDPGWKYTKVKVTAVDRGELEDTIILDWAHTVLYPNLITGIFVGSTYYPRPQNPLNHTTKEPLCHRRVYGIKLAYNVRDDQGINLCYSTDIEIKSHPKEYMLVDKEVSMKKVELSEDTYRVDWLNDMFHPPRYQKCLTGGYWSVRSGGSYDGGLMEPSQRVYLIKIPFCNQIVLDYRFHISKGNTPTVTKTQMADCDKTQEELDSWASKNTLVIGIFTLGFIALLAIGLCGGYLIWIKTKDTCHGRLRGGVVHSGPSGFQTQPVPPANVYVYRPETDNLQSGPYIPCSQADSHISPSK